MSDWRDEARCLNNPLPWDTPDPDDRGPTKAAREAAAIKVCIEDCPVINTCLESALANETSGSAYNIWGGKTADERKAILRQRAKQRDRDAKKARRLAEKAEAAA